MKSNLLFGVILLSSALTGCPKSSNAGAGRSQAIPVEVASVIQRDIPIKRETIGTVEPLSSVQLKSKVQGEIVKVHFSDGAQVNAGEVLFSIDPRSYEAALQRAQAKVAVAQANFDNAKEQADRYTTLSNRGVASKEQFTQIRTAAITAASELAAQQADLAEAQLFKDWTSVVAPISGRAGAALIKLGNIVQSNNEVLVVINQTKPTYVLFALPEADLDEVRERLAAGPLRVAAKNPDNGEVLGEGELVFINNAVDRESGMFTLKASFPNETESLWPGKFVDVTLSLAEQKNALTIPSEAILDSQKGSQVFVVEKGGVELRKVVIERTVAGDSVIRSGLMKGETVVISGQLRLTSGAKVDIQTPVATGSDS